MMSSNALPEDTAEGPPETGPVPGLGWEQHFQRMAENGDDALLDADTFSLSKWDETEWVR